MNDAMLITTRRLIDLLQSQDPTGNMPVSFLVCDEDHHDSVVAHGEVTTIDYCVKHAQSTDEGDRDVLRLHVYLIRAQQD